MERALKALALSAALCAAAPAFADASETSVGADWLAASAAFRLELHALAAEALMLQIETPLAASAGSSRADRKLRWDAQTRLSESLKTANAFLSMMEIAEHSDRGPRVREVLLIWLGSARISLAEHLSAEAIPSSGGATAAETAVFLEELKILWRRLDRAYTDLQSAIAS
jgi:hypothetical protein